jgi:hypothetical protein
MSITFLKTFFLVFYLSLSGLVLAEQKAGPSAVSIEAAQVGSVSSVADAVSITKSWADKTQQGINGMIQQEQDVTLDIQKGVERLTKSCELATALKQNAPSTSSSDAGNYERIIEEKVARREKNRTDLLAAVSSLEKKINSENESSCGFLGLNPKDPISCEVEKYKKQMAELFKTSINSFYEKVFQRYAQYRIVVKQSKSACVQADFLARLMRADDEYLVPFEDRSYNVFSRLISSVSAAFLNQIPK